MPPELLLNGHMSKAVDVFSFGVIVWEMYCGCRPYAGMSHSQVLHAIGMGRLLQLPQDMPAPLRDLLAACMARDPAKRYAGCGSSTAEQDCGQSYAGRACTTVHAQHPLLAAVGPARYCAQLAFVVFCAGQLSLRCLTGLCSWRLS
jgi:hypothetical protein